MEKDLMKRDEKSFLRLVLAGAIFLLLSTPLQLLAHQDTLLSVSKEGKLQGLPKEYEPAFLQISKGGQFSSTSVKLKIKGHAVKFPSCISNLFSIPATERMTISASWYHDLSLLPPYLAIYLPQRTSPKDSSWFDGHTIVINLRTAEIISLQKNQFSDYSVQRKPVKLDSICTAREMAKLKPITVQK
jgi:hypothetical protein